MGERHEKPIPADTAGGTNLVFIQSQLLLSLAKENLDWPSFQVEIQNLLCWEAVVCAEESTEGMRHPKGILWIGNQNNGIFQISQATLITKLSCAQHMFCWSEQSCPCNRSWIQQWGLTWCDAKPGVENSFQGPISECCWKWSRNRIYCCPQDITFRSWLSVGWHKQYIPLWPWCLAFFVQIVRFAHL